MTFDCHVDTLLSIALTSDWQRTAARHGDDGTNHSYKDTPIRVQYVTGRYHRRENVSGEQLEEQR